MEKLQILLILILIILFPCLILWVVRTAQVLGQWTTRGTDVFFHLRTISEKAIESQPPRWLSRSTLRRASERLLTMRNDRSTN
jgi:hypothetical protein